MKGNVKRIDIVFDVYQQGICESRGSGEGRQTLVQYDALIQHKMFKRVQN